MIESALKVKQIYSILSVNMENKQQLRNKVINSQEYIPKNYSPRPYSHDEEAVVTNNELLPVKYEVLHYRKDNPKEGNVKIAVIVDEQAFWLNLDLL